MSRIQWNPIVAPDIGSEAMRAQQLAGASIKDAFSSFSGVLDQWEGSQQQREMAELIARQERFLSLIHI